MHTSAAPFQIGYLWGCDVASLGQSLGQNVVQNLDVIGWGSAI